MYYMANMQGYSQIILIRFLKLFQEKLCPSFHDVVRTYVLIPFPVLYPHCSLQTSSLDRAAIFLIQAAVSILHSANIYFSRRITHTLLLLLLFYVFQKVLHYCWLIVA